MKRERRSGVLVPLFSMVSSTSWGTGEFGDLPKFATWATSAKQSFVQILPITELPEAESSPYSALTAMALDPLFISVPAVEDFVALGGDSGLSPEDRTAIAELQQAGRVRHEDVRALKDRVLRRAYRRFVDEEVSGDTARAADFRRFTAEHAAWLNDYALFQALRTRFRRQPWWTWPEPVVRRVNDALRAAAEEHRSEIGYRKYVQWIADRQWAEARRAARPLQVFGDVPFMISADSPDVWTRQREFRFDATVGVPPDAFSETGQDWGLPPWRWDVMAKNDFAWMHARARRTAALFDGFRLDHLVGLYRTYIRPTDKSQEPFFAPADEATQRHLGERLVRVYVDTGAEVIAEDLGTVPDFVRQSLRRLDVPGFKVLRWERRWKRPGQPFIDPADYGEVSVATTATHDTEPLVTWWATAPDEERQAVREMPSMKKHLADSASELDALLRSLLDAKSRLTIVPLQDIFGWPDRINTPAQISERNWTWIVPWPVDGWQSVPDAQQRGKALARWTVEANR